MEENIKGAIERLSKAQNDIWYATLYSQEEQDEDIKLLIKGYRELEEKYNNLKMRHNGTKEALRVSEDLERHFSEEASNLEAELDNYIPKSKIKEMIENREQSIDDIRNNLDINQAMMSEIKILEVEIDILQELLEDK